MKEATQSINIEHEPFSWLKSYRDRSISIAFSSIISSATTRAIRRGRSYVEGDEVPGQLVGEDKFPDADARFTGSETVTPDFAEKYAQHYPEVLTVTYGERLPESLVGKLERPELQEKFVAGEALSQRDEEKIQRMVADIDAVRFSKNEIHPRLKELVAGTEHESAAREGIVTGDMLGMLYEQREQLERLRSGDATPEFLEGKWKEPEAHQKYEKGDPIAEPLVGQRRKGIVGNISAAFDNTVGRVAKKVLPAELAEHYSGDRWLDNATGLAMLRYTNIPAEIRKYRKGGDTKLVGKVMHGIGLLTRSENPGEDQTLGGALLADAKDFGTNAVKDFARNKLGCYAAMAVYLPYVDKTGQMIDQHFSPGYYENGPKVNPDHNAAMLAHMAARFTMFNMLERVAWRRTVYDLGITGKLEGPIRGSDQYSPIKDSDGNKVNRFSNVYRDDDGNRLPLGEQLSNYADIQKQLLGEIATGVPIGALGLANVRTGKVRHAQYHDANNELQALKDAGRDDLAEIFYQRNEKAIEKGGILDNAALFAGTFVDKLGGAVHAASGGLISEEAAKDWAYWASQYQFLSGYSTFKWDAGPYHGSMAADRVAFRAALQEYGREAIEGVGMAPPSQPTGLAHQMLGRVADVAQKVLKSAPVGESFLREDHYLRQADRLINGNGPVQ